MNIKDILYWIRVVFVCLIGGTIIGTMVFLMTHKEYSEYNPNNILMDSKGELLYREVTCTGVGMTGKPTGCTDKYTTVPPAYYIKQFMDKYHVFRNVMMALVLWCAILIYCNRKELKKDFERYIELVDVENKKK